MASVLGAPGLLDRLQSEEPLLWLNPNLGSALPEHAPSHAQITQAERRLAQCEALMRELFPVDIAGPIESELMEIGRAHV